MRSLVAGVNDAGRTCILSELVLDDRDVDDADKSVRNEVYALRETPPPQRPPATGGYHETGLEPGHVFFVVLQMPPKVEHPMHHTDTLNFHTIVAGSLEIILDDGPHPLDCGDSLVLPGIDHGWRAGPSGCTMTIVNIGSLRP